VGDWRAVGEWMDAVWEAGSAPEPARPEQTPILGDRMVPRSLIEVELRRFAADRLRLSKTRGQGEPEQIRRELTTS
jgi:hypothetical protein